MRDALAKERRIHRDIGDGNIILVQEEEGIARKGYLIDWESSSRVDEEGFSLDRTRTVSSLSCIVLSITSRRTCSHEHWQGTWKFMSISVVNASPKPHTIRDDMESLFYVVLYLSLLHLPHDIDDPGDLRTFIHNFFNHSAFIHGALRGGDSKLTNAATRSWTSQVMFGSSDLQAWLNTVMDYHSPPYHLREEFGDRWTNPDCLDSFWGDFLKERTLSQDDRVNNEIEGAMPIMDSAPNSLVPFARVQRSTVVKDASTVQRLKRPATCLTAFQELEADATPVPLRRSERLRTRDVARQSGPSVMDVLGRDDRASKRLRIG